ncbi:MAG: ABC transporter ATP-binding protein [Campylobacterota bacterium]
MIDIQNLRYGYGDKTVLNGIDLHIPKGSVFGLLGPNAAGKTTLVSILTGLLKGYEGRVCIDAMDMRANCRRIQAISSLVPQSLAFYKRLSAVENLEFFAGLYGVSGRDLSRRVQYAIAVTGLEEVAYAKAYTYSGGLQRRLNIAIGLLNAPKVIYLDEPTVGIDPQSRNRILAIIKELNAKEGITVVYTSHYMQEVAFLCNRIAIIDRGDLIYSAAKNTQGEFGQDLEKLFLQTVKNHR